MLGQWTRLAWLAIVGRYLAMVIQLVLSQPWNQKGKDGEVWFGRPGC